MYSRGRARHRARTVLALLCGAFVSLTALVLAGQSVSAAPATAALEFVDTRPIIIDTSVHDVGTQWRVSIVSNAENPTADVSLTSTVQPAGLVQISGPTLRSGQPTIIDFTLTLLKRTSGTGELVAIQGASVARRSITLGAPGTIPAPVKSIEFDGVRLMPFGSHVRMKSVTIPDAAGTTSEASEVGTLSRAGGGRAEIVRSGDTFSVQGAHTVGEYTGTVDLTPGKDGGKVDATASVRDLPGWPLAVLIIGLAIVQVLNTYQSNRRPRLVVQRRLARLLDSSRNLQATTGDALQIVARTDQPLLLTALVGQAIREVDTVDDTDRAQWEPGGDKYKELYKVWQDYADAVDSWKTLTDRRSAFVRSLPAGLMQPDFTGTALGAALAQRAVTTRAALKDLTDDLAAGDKYLDDFEALYERLHRLGTEPNAVAAANQLIVRLLTDPTSLEQIKTSAEPLTKSAVAAAQAEADDVAGAAPLPGVAASPGFPPPTAWAAPAPAPGPSHAPTRASRRLRVPLILAAVAVLFVLVAVTQLGGSANKATSPSPSSTASASASPTGRPPEILDAPVAPIADTPLVGQVSGRSASAAADVTYTLLPLVVLAAIAFAGLRWWRKRHPTQTGPKPLLADSTVLDRWIRNDDLRFNVASGFVVVLSGMSLLYVGQTTFGAPGDYLKMLLWGTSIGEGLQLARLIPLMQRP